MSVTGYKEMTDMIGNTVRVRVEGFTVPMTIGDVKFAYGNKRFLVSPIGGSGESWVDASRVTPMSMSTAAPTPSSRALRGASSATAPIPLTTEAGKIRSWAKDRGIHVNERGRIPEPVMREYLKTQADQDDSVGSEGVGTLEFSSVVEPIG